MAQVMMRTLADEPEWKEFMEKVREANKDPKFRSDIKRFIEISTKHRSKTS